MLRPHRAGPRPAGIVTPVGRPGLEDIFVRGPALRDAGGVPWIPFPAALRSQLLVAATAGKGREVCGFVGGTGGLPRSLYAVDNSAARPARRFEMAPDELLGAWQRIAQRGEELLGIYHSHVSGAAYPSPTDLAEHAYRDLLCIIVSASAPPGERLRAFLIGERATEVGLRADAAM